VITVAEHKLGDHGGWTPL